MTCLDYTTLTCQANISSSMGPVHLQHYLGHYMLGPLPFTFPALVPKDATTGKQFNLSPPGGYKDQLAETEEVFN